MNIILTFNCRNNCSYCFARGMAGRLPYQEMPLHEFETVIEFLKASGVRQVRLLGGEPMLHPDIAAILKSANEDDYFERTVVFSGGLFPAERTNLLFSDKTRVLFNVNEKRDYPQGAYGHVIARLENMVDNGVDVSLSYNIFRKDFDGSQHIALCEQLGIRSLRWNLANPGSAGRNEYLDVYHDTAFGGRLADFLISCQESGISTLVDCMVPPCLFTDETRGRLERINPGFGSSDLRSVGTCLLAVDVGPGLWAWQCFGLSDRLLNMTDFATVSDLRAEFAVRSERLRWRHIPKRCLSCAFSRSHQCQGGCLGMRGDLHEDCEESAEHLCDRLFQLAQSGHADQFLRNYDEWRNHPFLSQHKGMLVLDAVAAEIGRNDARSLKLWRAALRHLKEDKREWAMARIRQLKSGPQ